MWDEETELYYLRSRYYDAEIGRFVFSDIIINGNNTYTYIDSNPTNKRDPDGLMAVALPVDTQYDKYIRYKTIPRVYDVPIDPGKAQISASKYAVEQLDYNAKQQKL